MRVVILTPQRQLPDHQADHVIAPAHDGFVGIKPGHAPMVCQLGSGDLTIDHATEPRVVYVVDGGLLQVNDDTITVLAESATLKADVSENVLIEQLLALDAATYDDEMALTQAKAKAHWLRTQLQSIGKSVPETNQV